MNKSRYTPRLFSPPETRYIESFYSEGEPADGPIAFKLDRTPDFWNALKVEGDNNIVVTIFDNENDCIAAAMICSTKPVFMNSSKIDAGYISSLKVGESYKGSVVIARLFRYFKSYCANTNILFWFFSVFNSNVSGNYFFNRKSDFLPLFKPIENSITYIFKARCIKESKEHNKSVKIERLNEQNLWEVMSFIESETGKRAMVPAYAPFDLLNGKGLLTDLSANNIYVALRDDQVCGIMGIWSQNSFRRWRVDQYSKRIKMLKPLINLYSVSVGLPLLPKSGEHVPYQIFSLILIKDEDPEIFKTLFNTIINHNSMRTLYTISLLDSSPFNQYFAHKSIKMENRLFIGYWPSDEAAIEKLNFEYLYFEEGAL